MNSFYVYMYWDLEGNPIYVGMGKTRDRWKSHLSKSDNILLRAFVEDLRILGKLPICKKVVEGLSKTEAEQEEIRLIALHGRLHIDEGGVLFNRATGGSVNVGFCRAQSESEKLERSKDMQTFWNSSEGEARKLVQSEKAKIQMSEPEAKARAAAVGRARKGKPGKPQTDEWKAMIGPIVAESNRKRDCKPETREKRRINMIRIMAERKKVA